MTKHLPLVELDIRQSDSVFLAQARIECRCLHRLSWQLTECHLFVHPLIQAACDNLRTKYLVRRQHYET